MKRFKEFIIALVIIIIIVLIQLIIFKTGTEVNTNESNSTNTLLEDVKISVEQKLENEKTYSMQTGSSFAKIGNIIIYNNSTDNIFKYDCKEEKLDLLYTMEDGVNKLYFDGEYVYAMPNYYRGKGIYRIDLQGNAEKIYDGASIQLWLTADKIYFTDQVGYDRINGTPQGNLCIMNKDGSDKQTIIENVKNYFKIHNNTIYYTDLTSRSIYSANIDGANKKELAKGRTYISNVDDNCLTYIDFADNEAYRVIYLNTNENHKLGMFGNDVFSANGNYVFTRKGTDGNNIETEFSLYKINPENNTEEIIWKAHGGFERLAYIDDEFAYFTSGQSTYKVNLKTGEETDFPKRYYYYLNGYGYTFTQKDSEITSFEVCNLKTMEINKDDIRLKKNRGIPLFFYRSLENLCKLW